MDEEEDRECRVCRGPAEEGRSLYHPCKCSGSIGLVHQDCLISWLKVKMSRNGKCDLCSTKFKFVPLYAEGAPDQISTFQVVLAMCKRILLRYLPIFTRFIIAIILWLFFLPLFTAYLYQGWLHRPSSVATRLQWDWVVSDAISGAVVGAVIIISFLSLMSFADFLRVHWDPQAAAAAAGAVNNNNRLPQQQQRNRPNVNHIAAMPINPEGRHEFQEPLGAVGVPNHINNMQRMPLVQPLQRDLNRPRFAADIEERAMERRHFERQRQRDMERLQTPSPLGVDDKDHDDDDDNPKGDDNINENVKKQVTNSSSEVSLDEIERMIQMQEDQNDDVSLDDGLNNNMERHPAGALVNNPRNVHENDVGNLPQPPPRNPRINNNPGAIAMEPEEGVELDINIALDELLGLHGPFPILLRNLLWFSAFNTVYLGMFAFIPHVSGRFVFSKIPVVLGGINILLPKVFPDISFNPFLSNFWNILSASINTINLESSQRHNLLLLPDISFITLGYLSTAVFLLFTKFVVSSYKAARASSARAQNNAAEVIAHVDVVAPDHDVAPGHGEEDINIQAFIMGKLHLVLEAASAISKVGILLLLKMLVLPLFLGICLDLATLPLFRSTLEHRVLFAGNDIFAAILIHWVVGITFMLVVTVAVLQLREVAHPDLLAPFVRPQEPQPDLLGNLLKDSGLAHAKRMAISLSIYLTLLGINIWLPAKMLCYTGLREFIPLFRPKFYYILPQQLQIPVECLVFHLSMLSVLEKHKNRIGELQHSWLLKVGRFLGLADHLLPRTVEKFVKIGFIRKDDRKFWSQLRGTKNQAAFIALIHKSAQQLEETVGTLTDSGKRVLTRMGTYSISVYDDGGIVEIPNVIGPYRLSEGWNHEMDCSGVYVWKEVLGLPIPRPPEGWDDLGVGNAEAQGRWAWGAEKKSKIEESVAARTPFFADCFEVREGGLYGKKYAMVNAFVSVLFKATLLFFFSWGAMLVSVCFILSGPVAVGRLIFTLIYLPHTYFHDPAAFALGSVILFPLSWKAIHITMNSDSVLFKVTTFFKNFMVRSAIFSSVPRGKGKARVLISAFLLWTVLSPLCIGLVYAIFWTSDPILSLTYMNVGELRLLTVWGSGFTFLHAWGALCYLGAFRKSFWMDLIDDLGADEDRNRRDREREGNEIDDVSIEASGHRIDSSAGESIKFSTRRSWQGKHGRIHRFIKAIIAATFYSEWDQVDHVVLLDECCVPVIKQLVIVWFPPLATMLFLRVMKMIYYDCFFATSHELCQITMGERVLHRSLVAMMLSMQFLRGFMSLICEVGKSIHRAARDDKYLIGEILVNHEPVTTGARHEFF